SSSPTCWISTGRMNGEKMVEPRVVGQSRCRGREVRRSVCLWTRWNVSLPWTVALPRLRRFAAPVKHPGEHRMKLATRFLFSLGALLLLTDRGVPLARSQAGAAAEPKTDPRFEIPATDDGLPGAGPLRRYPWFRQLWSKRRSAWAQRVEQDQHALVFLGDSITQGWGDDIGGSFPGVKVANRGISGDTTRGVLIRLQEDVLALHPSGVVLLIGTNDLEEKADPETIAANLKLILAGLKAADPQMPIVLCQVFPSSAAKKRPVEQIKKINQLYAAAVKGDAQVTLVETWLLFADAQGDAKPAEFPDMLHPNKAGYTKWA